MRRLLKICIALTIIVSGFSFQKIGNSVTNEPSVSAHFDSISTWDRIYTTVTISNNTTDTIKYYSMTCSFSDFFICDNKEIGVYMIPCDKNWYKKITLAPNESEVLRLELKSSVEWKKLESVKLRIGFIFVNAKNAKRNAPYDINRIENEKKSKENIIWSNTIEIK
ncbi:MAG TPA: hypothetical protein VK890_04715 [Bacteroidia bacterium]|nr:hypothetical protein [Bacteroidia bacterium]